MAVKRRTLLRLSALLLGIILLNAAWAPPPHSEHKCHTPEPPPQSCNGDPVRYEYNTLWRYSMEAAHAHAMHILRGPVRSHVVCARINRDGNATLLAAWDNPSFPQHREIPFFDMLARWSRITAQRRQQACDVTACFFLQDDMEEVLTEATLPRETEAHGVPSFSNLVRQQSNDDGINGRRGTTHVAIGFPDHTFAHWKAGKQRPFDAFYRDCVCNDASSMRRVAFRDRRDVVFWRGQSTAAGRSRGNAGIGRRWMLHHIHATLQPAHPSLFDVSVVSVYFLNKTTDDTQYVSLDNHARYRYLLDLPGYGYSGRFKYLMLLGSVVLSVEHPDEEYWRQFLCPWVHYVPIRRDLSDLTFAVELLRSNVDVAERIANAGRARAALLFSETARFQYMSDVVTAYARGEGIAVRAIEGVPRCLKKDKARSVAFRIACGAPVQETRCGDINDQDFAKRVPQPHRAVCFSIAAPSIEQQAHLVGATFVVEHVGRDVPFQTAQALEVHWARSVCNRSHHLAGGVASMPPLSWCVVDGPPLANSELGMMHANRSIGQCANEWPMVMFAWRHRGDIAPHMAPDTSFVHWHQFYQKVVHLGSTASWLSRFNSLYWRGPPPKALQGLGVDSDAQSMVAATRIVHHGSVYPLNTSNYAGVLSTDAAFADSTVMGGWFDESHASQHRYALDIPGYGRFGHLKQLLLLGCTVLVVDTTIEAYWMSSLEPWVHYVPVRWDLEDLDVVLERLQRHATLAASIAERGRMLVLEQLNPTAVEQRMLASLMDL